MEVLSDYSPLSVALREVCEKAPGAPLLALGQTAFWDEPLKIMLPVVSASEGLPLRFVAGIHDTDYFAKRPGGTLASSRFVALPRNDGSTRGFWSAAGEFSALFGAETPVTREDFLKAGVCLERVLQGDASLWDQVTEAYGWRGIASTDSEPRTSVDIRAKDVFPCLWDTFCWAVERTLESLCDASQQSLAREQASALEKTLKEVFDSSAEVSLGEFYERLLPYFHRILEGEFSEVVYTRTSRLLQLNTSTCSLPRFRFVEIFLDPKTAPLAKRAYDEAVRGTEIYPLERFGEGAIPFDLVIPGKGRGTIRLTDRALRISTPQPLLIKLESPIRNLCDLSEVVSSHFEGCVLIGKAVTLISMLSREFVFVFHETGSPYLAQTQKLHSLLEKQGLSVPTLPILRVQYKTWDALEATDRWFHLPEPFQRPFGAEHVSAQTFAKVWQKVVDQERRHIESLGSAKGPGELIRILEGIKGGRWSALRDEYEQLSQDLAPIQREISDLRRQLAGAYEELRALKKRWQELEHQMGEHYRARLRAGNPSREDEEQRKQYEQERIELRHRRDALRHFIREIWSRQSELAQKGKRREAFVRRREIEKEAEWARLEVAREATLVIKGLLRSHFRPSAWWLPLVSPDGAWYTRLKETAVARLEYLSVKDDGRF